MYPSGFVARQKEDQRWLTPTRDSSERAVTIPSTGKGAADTILGDAGDDTLYGDGGNDMLVGDAGADTIYGGAGTDTIAGGGGDDTLTGGTDADTFVFIENSGNDTITDFDVDEDMIDLSMIQQSIAYSDLTITDKTDGTGVTGHAYRLRNDHPERRNRIPTRRRQLQPARWQHHLDYHHRE